MDGYRTVGEHVVDEPVVVVHAVFVDPPDPICIFRGEFQKKKKKTHHGAEENARAGERGVLGKMRDQEMEKR